MDNNIGRPYSPTDMSHPLIHRLGEVLKYTNDQGIVDSAYLSNVTEDGMATFVDYSQTVVAIVPTSDVHPSDKSLLDVIVAYDRTVRWNTAHGGWDAVKAVALDRDGHMGAIGEIFETAESMGITVTDDVADVLSKYGQAYQAQLQRELLAQAVQVGDRVEFTTTGNRGTVERTWIDNGPYSGDTAGVWARVRWDFGETYNNTANDLTKLEDDK